MKTLFFCIMLGITHLGFTQILKDQQEIVQKCIDDVELDKVLARSYPENTALVIENNGVISGDLPLVKYGMPVKFMTKEEMFFNNIIKYVSFTHIKVEASHAEVMLSYMQAKQATPFELSFEKKGKNWTME